MLDLAALNTATKYPSIPTYHALGDRGGLTEDVTMFHGVQPPPGTSKSDLERLSDVERPVKTSGHHTPTASPPGQPPTNTRQNPVTASHRWIQA
jgi:hypothetical protein